MDHPPIEVGPDDVSSRPRHTGHRWFDLLMAITAILLSSVSLVVAIDHGRTEHELVQAASWPFVQENTDFTDRSIAVSITNSGVGPAKMHWFEVSYGGRVVRTPTDLLAACCSLSSAPRQPLDRNVGGYYVGNPDEQVLRAGQDITVLKLSQDQPPSHLIQTLAHQINHLSFRGCYCSVLDECWIGDLETLKATPVRTCPANPGAFTVSVPEAGAQPRSP